MNSVIENISTSIGMSSQEVEKQILDYPLTSELDRENFELILDMICDDQIDRVFMDSDLPITRLSNYYGHTYGKLKRPFSSRTIIENIVPFLVINKWYKVFYAELKKNNKSISDYLITGDSATTKDIVKEHLEKIKYQVDNIEEIIV